MFAANPSYAYNSKAESLLSTGDTKLSAGNYKEAIADFTQAIELEPRLSTSDLVKAYFNRGLAKSGTGDSQGAKADFIKVTELDRTPKDAVGYYNRATAYSIIGNTREAVADYKKAASLGNIPAEEWLKKNGY